jgi:hypothetical protein
MDFINNFVCFSEQTVALTDSLTSLEVTSPFINVNEVVGLPLIKGLDIKLKDKSLMIFLINSTDNPFTLANMSIDVPDNQKIKVSTGANKTIQPNTFEVLVYCSNIWMIRDIVI